MPYCNLCSRPFSSVEALGQHLRDTPRHAFDCHLCRRHFKTASARDQHLRGSSKHYTCEKCGPTCDFATGGELVAHEVAEHNLCVVCQRYLSSRSNLREVSNPWLVLT